MHELHESFILLNMIGLIEALLLVATGDEVLITVKYGLPFETH